MNLCPTASEAKKSQLPILIAPERSDHDLLLSGEQPFHPELFTEVRATKIRGL